MKAILKIDGLRVDVDVVSFTRLMLVLLAFVMFSLSSLFPAFAQAPLDTSSDTGKQARKTDKQSTSQTWRGGNASVSQPLADRTSSSAQQRNDPAVIIHGTGTVRVNNLANLEALLNILANGLEVLFASGGIVLMTRSFRQLSRSRDSSAPAGMRWSLLWWGVALIALGLAIPGTINWFVASARDMSYFS